MSCSTCDTSQTIEESGSVYCKSCGILLKENKVDTTGDYRLFDDGDTRKKKRHEGFITFTRDSQGFETKIGNTNELQKVKPEKRGQYQRMKRWNSRRRNSSNRRLQYTIREVNKLCDGLNLPETVREESCRLVKKSFDDGHIEGRKMENCVAAIVYIVAKDYSVPRTLDEFVEYVDCEKRKLGKTYRYLARELDSNIVPIKPIDLLPRFSQELGLSSEDENEVRELLKENQDSAKLAGKRSKTILAGFIEYVTKGEGLQDREILQKDIVKATGISPVTVRKTRQKIENEPETEKVTV